MIILSSCLFALILLLLCLAHASVSGITKFIDKRYAGFAMKKELDFLLTTMNHPHRPVAAIIGGVKISTKIDLIMNLLTIVDKIFIGGAMVNTFYRALGHTTGDSAIELACIDTATDILKAAVNEHLVFRLASDCKVVSTSHVGEKKKSTSGGLSTVSFDSIPDHTAAIDIGARTIEDFQMELQSCQTIVWNGPLGKYEDYPEGTNAMIAYLSHCTREGKVTIVCGGDTVAAIEQFGPTADFSHISMGGGASLELLAGKTLPGVEALEDADATSTKP